MSDDTQRQGVPVSEWVEHTATIEHEGSAHDAQSAYIQKRIKKDTSPFIVIDCYPASINN